jgi:6-pyruvoyltetrahydropterin/6-carboxytetrahydropterin synthase
VRATITRRVRFEAAHFLPDYDGKCANMHGHSWSAEIVCAGPVEEGGVHDGMVFDMGDVARMFRQFLEPMLDHVVLNDTLPDVYLPPSTENVARFLYDRFFALGVPVVAVTVRETENQTATVSR